MSRRKAMATRKPCGRIYKAEPVLPPPSETRRLRDAALAGMRPAEWGTELGRLYLADKITALQYSAGRRWLALVAQQRKTCPGPQSPRSVNLERQQLGGIASDTTPETDSKAGVKLAKRERRTAANLRAANDALEQAGRRSVLVVHEVIEGEQVLVGAVELQLLRHGLQYLAAYWASCHKN